MSAAFQTQAFSSAMPSRRSIVPASRNPRLAVKGDGKYYVSALDRLTNESPAVLAR